MKVPPYLALGLIEFSELGTIALLFPIAICGAWLGYRITRIIPERAFYIIVEIALFLISINLIRVGLSALTDALAVRCFAYREIGSRRIFTLARSRHRGVQKTGLFSHPNNIPDCIGADIGINENMRFNGISSATFSAPSRRSTQRKMQILNHAVSLERQLGHM